MKILLTIITVYTFCLGLIVLEEHHRGDLSRGTVQRLQATVDQQASQITTQSEQITKLKNAVGIKSYMYARGKKVVLVGKP